MQLSDRNWKISRWLIVVVLLGCTYGLGYVVQQSDFTQIIALYLPFFLLYLLAFRFSNDFSSIRFFIFLGLIIRFFLVFSIPNLSDDIYRFIWDGRLLIQGHNPFEFLPSYYIENGIQLQGINKELYEKLNSPEYFTIYPPVAQFVFAISCLIFPNSILGSAIIMKLFIVAFEIGAIFFIVKLLKKFNLPAKNVLLYVLNPLIIIEISGNLHFEGAMIFFLLLGIWCLIKCFPTTPQGEQPLLKKTRLATNSSIFAGWTSRIRTGLLSFRRNCPRRPPSLLKEAYPPSENQTVISGRISPFRGFKGLPKENLKALLGGCKANFFFSATAIALSIASKLLPLIFLPFLIKRLGWKKSMQYFSVIGLVLILLFVPLLSEAFINNFGNSLNLYFQKFEFNASVYYIARWIGYQKMGYNLIHYLGPAFAFCTLTSILFMAFFERRPTWDRFFEKALFAICIYLLFSATVHPWYVSLPIVLCLFTRFRFPILWSGLVFLTYINYSYGDYYENLWVVTIEYVAVIGYLVYELKKGNKTLELQPKQNA